MWPALLPQDVSAKKSSESYANCFVSHIVFFLFFFFFTKNYDSKNIDVEKWKKIHEKISEAYYLNFLTQNLPRIARSMVSKRFTQKSVLMICSLSDCSLCQFLRSYLSHLYAQNRSSHPINWSKKKYANFERTRTLFLTPVIIRRGLVSRSRIILTRWRLSPVSFSSHLRKGGPKFHKIISGFPLIHRFSERVLYTKHDSKGPWFTETHGDSNTCSHEREKNSSRMPMVN